MNKDIVRELVRQGKFNHLDKEQRKEVYRSGKCPENMNVHHIIPESDGGQTEYDNLIPLKKTHHFLIHRADIIVSRNFKRQGVELDRNKQYFVNLILDTLPKKDKEYKKNIIMLLTDEYKPASFIKRARLR